MAYEEYETAEMLFYGEKYEKAIDYYESALQKENLIEEERQKIIKKIISSCHETSNSKKMKQYMKECENWDRLVDYIQRIRTNKCQMRLFSNLSRIEKKHAIEILKNPKSEKKVKIVIYSQKSIENKPNFVIFHIFI